jgi:hypothetical protein
LLRTERAEPAGHLLDESERLRWSVTRAHSGRKGGVRGRGIGACAIEDLHVEQERLLRAEVLLLVSIAEASEDQFPKGLGTPHAVVAAGGGWGISTRRGELEGGLGVAQAARVLSEGSAEWLRELARAFDRAAVWPEVSSERRGELDRLLDRLAAEGAAGDVDEASDPNVLFFQALETADFLGLVDGDQRSHWERRFSDLQGYDSGSESEHRDADSEPLVGLRAVLAGPVARGGQRLESVECYDGGLALRGESAVELPAGLRDSSSFEVHRHFHLSELDTDVEVTDDGGTSYRGYGSGASPRIEAGRYVSKWISTFTPGVPAQTRTLTVRVGLEHFDFDVTGVADRAAV